MERNGQLTFYDDFGDGLTGADVVGGNTFVCSTVTQFHMGVEKFSILGGLCSCGQVPSAHPGPHISNGMRAVSKALQAQSITRSEPNLVRQAGGIWRSCMKERRSIAIMKK